MRSFIVEVAKEAVASVKSLNEIMAKEADGDVRWEIDNATGKSAAIFSGSIAKLPKAADNEARKSILDAVRNKVALVRGLTDKKAT